MYRLGGIILSKTIFLFAFSTDKAIEHVVRDAAQLHIPQAGCATFRTERGSAFISSAARMHSFLVAAETGMESEKVKSSVR